jgi:His-Xaa-Ser system radical SAM maturase HxsC
LLQPADVVIPNAQSGQTIVLYRESDIHHGLLLTNRCNSFCLMCSQPPTKSDDSWLVEEALDVIRHIRCSPQVIGISGGEPLLLGSQLRRVIDAIRLTHPKTCIEVLTNGRLLGEPFIVEEVLHRLPEGVHWLVPLYGHTDFFHDFVVQSRGAFEQTLAGLLALQECRQAVQLRIVLIEPVLQTLEELCSFIGRNLPFVREVALMACEPIGFALANRDLCEVDLGDWGNTLLKASRILNRHAVPHLFMNAPLCALPRPLWTLAHRSISDWKSSYASECARCAVKDKCSGLFAWNERGWKPTKIRAIEGA